MQQLYMCQACTSTFPANEIVTDARDDRHCPVCGSLRLIKVPLSRLEKFCGFLRDYEHV